MDYESVELNGNIHLMGTQGVGKSTLLRAILFFYNAAPENLGIRKNGQKSFTDYYLPYTNSYIVYEVNRVDDRPFCVIVYRGNNVTHPLFRFVDAPFNKEWLIDADGHVASDNLQVKRNIGAIPNKSVKYYREYLDVIYGNSHEIKTAEMKRYYILQSSQYHNIPKMIEKVFLNANVDANFIKDTIISSIGEENEQVPSISLRSFRDKLTEFSKEYDDIQKWFKLDKNGENEATKRAGTLIEELQTILANETYLMESLRKLKYSYKKTEEELPELRLALGRLKEDIAKEEGKLEKLNNDHQNKRDDIVQKLAVVKNDISKCISLKKDYKEKDIETILQLDSQEDAYNLQVGSLQKKIDELVCQHEDIVKKFENIINGFKADIENFRQKQEGLRIQKQEEHNVALKSLFEEEKKLTEQNAAYYEEILESVDKDIEERRNRVADIDVELAKVKNSKPNEDKIQAAQVEYDNYVQNENTLKNDRKHENARMESLRKDCELEVTKIKGQYDKDLLEIEQNINGLAKEIKNEQALLDKAKGSFCEWLDNNKSDWADNIGKVITDDVLYNQDLTPSIASGSNASLYGVEIDLSEVEREVSTPKMIDAKIADLTSQVDEFKKQRTQKNEDLQKEIEKTEKKFNGNIKEIRKSLDSIEQQLLVLPNAIEKAHDHLNELKQQQIDERTRLIEELNVQKGEANAALASAKEKKSNILGDRTKRAEKIKKDFLTKNKAEKDRYNNLSAQINEQISNYRKSIGDKIHESEQQRDQSLKENGVDLTIRDKWENECKKLQNLLVKISDNKEIIINYQRDKKEYLDKEQEFAQKKDKLEKNLAEVESTHEARRKKLTDAIDAKKNKKNADERFIEDKEHGLEDAQVFIESDGCPSVYATITPLENNKECSDIVSSIHNYRGAVEMHSNKLKSAVNSFKNLFSEANTFKFPEALNDHDDYKKYAQSVYDFVSNNKIRDYKQVTNKLYSDIIISIGNTFNNIQTKQSDIDRVIKDINYDFDHKGFGGVIKKIELKLEANENDLINGLAGITDFYVNNADNLGELTFFSSVEDNERANKDAVKYMRELSDLLKENAEKEELKLTDVFTLKLRVKENDNDFGFQENFRMVGSDGTDVLVKAIINIMLINVFKKRATKKSSDYILHCMMDEIGRLSNENIQGLLKFAADRDIYIVNSSPQPHKPSMYRHLYVLTKNDDAITKIQPILSTKAAALQQNDENTVKS